MVVGVPAEVRGEVTQKQLEAVLEGMRGYVMRKEDYREGKL